MKNCYTICHSHLTITEGIEKLKMPCYDMPCLEKQKPCKCFLPSYGVLGFFSSYISLFLFLIPKHFSIKNKPSSSLANSWLPGSEFPWKIYHRKYKSHSSSSPLFSNTDLRPSMQGTVQNLMYFLQDT
jgi:hypothetical protein